MTATAASVLLVDGEYFELDGTKLFASREPQCHFCLKSGKTPNAPSVSFIVETRDEPIRMHGQLQICAEHLRELAQAAERAIER